MAELSVLLRAHAPGDMELTEDGALVNRVWKLYQSSQQQYTEFESTFVKLFRGMCEKSLGESLPLGTGRAVLTWVSDVAHRSGEDNLTVQLAERAISLTLKAMSVKQNRAQNLRAAAVSEGIGVEVGATTGIYFDPEAMSSSTTEEKGSGSRLSAGERGMTSGAASVETDTSEIAESANLSTSDRAESAHCRQRALSCSPLY